MLRHINGTLVQDNEILVSQSLSVDKRQLTLPVLIDALFYDLETGNLRIPRQLQRREQAIRDLIKKRQKPIALFIDDAHDVRINTLVELKRLIEAVREEGGTLSAILAGQPKLKNVVQSPALEAIGSPAVIFDLEGFGDAALRYLQWLLTDCLDSQTKIDTVLTEQAMLFLGGNSSTPLQLQAHLTRAFEEGYQVGQKPVTAEVIESVLTNRA
jgi:type II secretory pathway predicted ATPase ExeA